MALVYSLYKMVVKSEVKKKYGMEFRRLYGKVYVLILPTFQTSKLNVFSAWVLFSTFQSTNKVLELIRKIESLRNATFLKACGPIHSPHLQLPSLHKTRIFHPTNVTEAYRLYYSSDLHDEISAIDRY